MRLRATREVYYQSKTRNVGDEFNATDQDARILIGIGKAMEVVLPIIEPAKPAVAAPVEATKVMEATADAPPSPPAKEPVIADDESRPKRRYMRRDMQAKE